MRRGEIWWAALPAPIGSQPGYRRPVLIVQSDDFTESDIRTVLAVSLTTNNASKLGSRLDKQEIFAQAAMAAFGGVNASLAELKAGQVRIEARLEDVVETVGRHDVPGRPD